MTKVENTTIEEILSKLEGARQVRPNHWMAKCPAHDDHTPSLSIKVAEDEKILLYCHAGCTLEDICFALGIKVKDLFPEKGGGSKSILRNAVPDFLPQAEMPINQGFEGSESSEGKFSDLPTPSLTLEQLAEAKQIPLTFLKAQKLETIHVKGTPCVRIPYFDETGNEIATRFRLSLNGDMRFRWKRNSQALPYGLWQLKKAHKKGWVLLVEGESDCWTLWLYDVPARLNPT